jgi:hypothetical protein
MTKHKPKSEREPIEKPYGWILILRGLARAAIILKDLGGTLRVLCIATEYMNQDGVCRISQSTIAARLDIKRQSVNRHLQILVNMDILIADKMSDGVTLKYYLNMDGLEDEREGQDRVDAYRAAKRAAKKGELDPAVVKPKVKAEPQPSAPQSTAPTEAPAKEVAADHAWMVGCEAEHVSFGRGIITDADGKTITVNFRCGPKKVRLDFITVHAIAPKRGEAYEPEVPVDFG